MNTEQRHVRRTLNWLIRPALWASIGLTLYGNLSQAQPSAGGRISHGWAPVLYLVLVEILIRKAVGGGWRWPVATGFVLLALIAGVVSFTSLDHAARSWGWQSGQAWMFPVIVDLTAVLLTMASMGAGVRVRELAGVSSETPERLSVSERLTETPDERLVGDASHETGRLTETPDERLVGDASHETGRLTETPDERLVGDASHETGRLTASHTPRLSLVPVSRETPLVRRGETPDETLAETERLGQVASLRSETPPVPYRQIAERLGVSVAQAGRLGQRAERDGLICLGDERLEGTAR